MNSIEINEKIKNGSVLIGTHVMLGDIGVSDIIGCFGYDYVWVDLEHTSIDKRELLLHIIALQGRGNAVFVRIPWNDPILVKPILDMGPEAVIFPNIKTGDEAKKAVSACLYPPEGIRGYGPFKAIKYGEIDNMDYIKNAKKSFLKIIQIEHYEAVNNIDEILQVAGIDAIIVGPHDLSGSLGLLGETNHPNVKALMDKISVAARKWEVPLGVSLVSDPPVVSEWLERGASLISVDGDIYFLANGAKNTLIKMKNIISSFCGR